MKYFIATAAFILMTSASYGQSPAGREHTSVQRILAEDSDSLRTVMLMGVVDTLPANSPERTEYSVLAVDAAERYREAALEGIANFYAGLNYFSNAETDEAERYLLNASELSDDDFIAVNALGLLSNIAAWNKNPEQAVEYANKGLARARSGNNPDIVANAYTYLAEAYRYNGDFDRAVQYYWRTAEITDSLERHGHGSFSVLSTIHRTDFDLSATKVLFPIAMDLKVTYDRGSAIQKQLHVLSLAKMADAYHSTARDAIIKEVKLLIREKTNLYLSIGIAVLVVMIGLLVWMNLQKNRANRKLAKENELKSRFFCILNHDMRSPIASFVNYLSVRRQDPGFATKEQSEKFETETISKARGLLNAMDDIMRWCKLEMLFMEPYLRKIKASQAVNGVSPLFEFENTGKIRFDVHEDFELTTDLDYLKTIIRNLAANALTAIKDKPEGLVTVAATLKNAEKVIVISDNGAGIDEDNIDVLSGRCDAPDNNKGMGLMIVRDLGQAIGCRIEVDSRQDEGSTFILHFDK